MILHPEFMRLVKRELSWPLVALVLVISGLGWWSAQQDFEEELTLKSTIYIRDWKWHTSKDYSVSIVTQEVCVSELIAQSGVDSATAEEQCAMERNSNHIRYFVTVVSILLVGSAARVINAVHADFKYSTWDYQRLGSHAPWRLALAKILGGAALAFCAFFLNAGAFLALAPTPDLQNLGSVGFIVLVVGVAAAVPFLAYVYQVVEVRTPSLLLVWGTSIFAAVVLNVILPIELIDLMYYLSNEEGFKFLGFVFPEISAAILISATLMLFLFVGASRLLRGYQKSVQKPWFLILSVFVLSLYVYGIYDPKSGDCPHEIVVI
jgi:hypothetical protein